MVLKEANVRRRSASGDASNLGIALRNLRARNKWSLAHVSAKTGLAVSTLSRIENNQLSLTYEKLLQLSRGLDLDLTELLTGNQDGPADVRTGRRTYTPPGAGRIIETNAYVYRYMCTELTGKKMTPIVGDIKATSVDEAGGYLRHDGEEVVYVLQGTLALHTEFYEPLIVETGGCVYFDSLMGHAFVAVGGPVTILSICTGADAGSLSQSRGRPVKI